MKVLGISPLDQDATVSLAVDGEVQFAAAEERFSRVKQHAGFPWGAIEAAFEATGTDPSEVDLVTYPFFTWQQETELFERNLGHERTFLEEFGEQDLQAPLAEAERRVPRRTVPIPGLSHPNERMEKGRLKELFYQFAGGETVISRNVARHASRSWGQRAREYHRRWQEELESGLSTLGLFDKLERSEHHLAHAANAYLASGFERALIVTLDGYGSGLAGSVSAGEGGEIRRLHDIEYPHSLGTFYETVTSALGFRPCRHEGKIVGLAAYGDPGLLEEVLLGRFELVPGSYRILEGNNVYFSRHLASRFPKIDVAAAYQRVLEVVACGVIAHWLEQTGLDRVVLSGGVAANVKLNQRIFEIDGVKGIFVYPNMGDGGCGTGLAMLRSWPGGVRPAIDEVFWGPGFGVTEMRSELERAGVAYERPDDLAEQVADEIFAGRVVARFDGRMEYGPRALGNRSILYHARDPAVNRWLNQRLGRTEFMPFAPVTLWEARDDYYRDVEGAERTAQFMTITFDCTERMLRECPAAVHVDGTARPQLIRRDVNPGYYDIVRAYARRSGISTLINTSFNMHEEPIVCTPRDAIRAFLHGNLDRLVLGPYLVRHPLAESTGP